MKWPWINNDIEEPLTRVDIGAVFFLIGFVAFLAFAQLHSDQDPCTASPTAACEHPLPLR